MSRTCDHVTGACLNLCQDERFGEKCQYACPHGNSATAVCIQCPAGKTGKQCDKDCGFGQYGVGCNKRCSAYCKKDSCHAVNGSCKSGCIHHRVMPLCR
ncbi:multiple epidermal growth factor-like domains 6, partial [Elysia marginata]